MVAGLKLDEAVFAAWIKGATYPVTWSPCSWATSIGSNIRHGLHRRAAEVYARRYHDQHGRLPEGLHHVKVSVRPHGKPGDGEIEHPFNSYLSDRERVFEADHLPGSTHPTIFILIVAP
jgi:hypothetical protein